MSTPATQLPVQKLGAMKNNQLVYLIFAREVGPLVKAKYPTIQKLQFNQILGRIWNEMPVSEREKYHQKAELQLNQQKLEDFQTSVKQEQNKSEKVSEPASTQDNPTTNVYTMDTTNNEQVKRIYIQPIENGMPSPASKNSIEDSKIEEEAKQTQPQNPMDMMKQYPMFPMYYKNMYATLKKIYVDKSDKELKLKAFAMFQEMLLSDQQFSSGITTIGQQTVPEPEKGESKTTKQDVESTENLVFRDEESENVEKDPLEGPDALEESDTLEKETINENEMIIKEEPVVDNVDHLLAESVDTDDGVSLEESAVHLDQTNDLQNQFSEISVPKSLIEIKTERIQIESTESIDTEAEVFLDEPAAPLDLNEPVAPMDADEPSAPLDANQMVDSQDQFSVESVPESSVKIKTEGIQIEIVQSLLTQEDTTELPPPPIDGTDPSANEDISSDKTETQLKDPKAQVVFHNLDFFIKTEESETESEESRKENPEANDAELATKTEPSVDNEEQLSGNTIDNEELETTTELVISYQNASSVEQALPIIFPELTHSLEPIVSPDPIVEANTIVSPKPIVTSEPIVSPERHDGIKSNLGPHNKKVKKSEPKDELKNLIDVLVSKRSADKEIIRKIVTKTRASLKQAEQPDLNYRRTQKPDLAKSSTLYCYCRSPSSKDLIGCDFCPEWFHPTCLGLSKYELKMVLSLSNWKCPECIKTTDGNKKAGKSRYAPTRISPKNRISPVMHTSPPSKFRRKETNKKEAVENISETESNIVKEDSKSKCDTCHILVREVKRRGDIIESLEKKVKMLQTIQS